METDTLSGLAEGFVAMVVGWRVVRPLGEGTTEVKVGWCLSGGVGWDVNVDNDKGGPMI